MSVFLTDEPLNSQSFYNYISSPTQNKVEQFLSVISSLSSIEFNTAEIHYEVSSEYRKWINQINDQIISCIPKATIFTNRLQYFADWQKVSEQIPDETETVLLKSNHDHAFLHSSPSLFYRFIRDINIDGDYYIGEISHWPEAIGNSGLGNWERTHDKNSFYSVTNTSSTIGTCLIHPAFFKSWWKNDFTNGTRIVRPDNPFGPSVIFDSVKKITPNCEFFRHMDGYGHQRIYAPIASPIRSSFSIVDGKINFLKWTKGNFLLTNKKPDLPIEPKLDHVNSIAVLLNLTLLAATYKFNIKNIWYLSQAFRFKLNKYICMSLLLICILDRYFVSKILRQILKIDSIKFRINQLTQFLKKSRVR